MQGPNYARAVRAHCLIHSVLTSVLLKAIVTQGEQEADDSILLCDDDCIDNYCVTSDAVKQLKELCQHISEKHIG